MPFWNESVFTEKFLKCCYSRSLSLLSACLRSNFISVTVWRWSAKVQKLPLLATRNVGGNLQTLSTNVVLAARLHHPPGSELWHPPFSHVFCVSDVTIMLLMCWGVSPNPHSVPPFEEPSLCIIFWPRPPLCFHPNSSQMYLLTYYKMYLLT